MSNKGTNQPFKSNQNIVYRCIYHVIFCPKYRRGVLQDGVDARLKDIVMELAVELQFGIHRIVKAIKGRSSRLLRQEFPKLKSRLPTLWTNSYFVATCGGAPLAIIKQYIQNQKSV